VWVWVGIALFGLIAFAPEPIARVEAPLFSSLADDLMERFDIYAEARLPPELIDHGAFAFSLNGVQGFVGGRQ
jgi:hypothetical protein